MRFPGIAMALCTATFAIAAYAGDTQSSASGNQAERPAEAYTPGMGEIMGATQMRHVKLWFAGQAENWELADYEVDELGEGFDDIVKYHPTHKESPVAPKDAIPRMVTQPLKDLRAAIEKKDAKAFVPAYDSLTAACNNCHQATNFTFNVVQTPATNPYPNQAFTRGK